MTALLVKISALNIERDRERRDGEARAAGSDRRQRDDHADDRRARRPRRASRLRTATRWPTSSRAAIHAPEPGQRELAQRQLPRVTGDDDDRAQDDRDRERRDERVGPRVHADEQRDRHDDRRPRAGASETRPLPGSGRRASVSPRCRRDRPVTIMYTRMMASGTAATSPVSDAALTPNALAMSGWNSEISLCTMPMPSAASTVMPNDEKRPTSAAASAGQHRERQDGGVQADDRGEEDRGERRQPARDREVRHLDAVGRPSRARRDPPVLGDGRGGEAEQRPASRSTRSTTAQQQRDTDEHRAGRGRSTRSPNSVTFFDGSNGRGWRNVDAPPQHHERLKRLNSPSVAMSRASRDASRSSAITAYVSRPSPTPDEQADGDGRARSACRRRAGCNRRRRRCRRARRR